MSQYVSKPNGEWIQQKKQDCLTHAYISVVLSLFNHLKTINETLFASTCGQTQKECVGLRCRDEDNADHLEGTCKIPFVPVLCFNNSESCQFTQAISSVQENLVW